MHIPLSNVNLGEVERANVADALERSWISGTGDYIPKFEQALADKVQCDHAIAVTNGTLALELALKAIGITEFDDKAEVIVPALTFVAPAAAVRAVGALPVFVDVHPDHWTIDPDLLSPLINRHTQAIIAVDLLGHPASYADLKAAAWNGVQHIEVIEDAAEAHGALHYYEPVGSLGDIATFSFHANKTISTGEGGALLTNTTYIANKARLIANHGMTPDRPYYHEIVGSNYRMTNLTAAIGLGQVGRWDELVEARNCVAARYDQLLADVFQKGDLYRRPVAPWATEACWLYTVAHPNRDAIVAHLRAQGIDARAIWSALCDLPLYKDSLRGSGYYPVAQKISREAFWLPTWAGMPEECIETVANALKEAL